MKKIIITTLSLGMLLMDSCVKDTTLIIKKEPAPITKTVYFSKDLVPIFSKNCAVSGCHATGGQKPDLSADKAYSSLMNDPDFVNIKDPTSSELYGRLTGKITPAMPMGKANNPSNINSLVLAWMKQGAKKN